MHVAGTQSCLSGGSSKGPFIVTAATGGTGTGTFSSSPAGIDCGSNGTACSASFTTGTMVTLTAIPDDGSHFTGWSQACTGAGTCVLDMISDQQLTAGFDLNPDLAVSFPGNGSGTVNSTRLESIAHLAVMRDLLPEPWLYLRRRRRQVRVSQAGEEPFGTGSCAVTMNSDQSVSANFIAPTFSLSAFAPSTLSPGQSTTSNVTLTSVNGFNSTVNFTCSVQPAPALAPTCGMNPSSATPELANASVSSTLTMNTLAPSFSAIPPLQVFLMLCGCPSVDSRGWESGFPGRPNRKRRLWLAILSCALAAGVVLHAACGSSSPKQTASGGTPTGNYTVTITGTSGATQISTTVTLTVQ